MKKLNLEKTQLCFQYLMMTGNATTSNIFFKNEESSIDFNNHIKGSSTSDKLERINIYSRGYYQRLIACLKIDYPSLVNFLGEDLFNHFAFNYIKENPSKSYTLYELGDSFHLFLQKTQPTLDNLSNEDIALYLFPLELIKLEKCRKKILTSKGIEDLDLDLDLKYKANQDKTMVNPSVELIDLKLDLLHNYYQLINGFDIEESPNLKNCIVLGFRVDYKPQFIYITKREATYIRALKSNTTNHIEYDKDLQMIRKKFINLKVIY